ncbi:MAG: hypothetical protein VX969_00080, partial [Verrucomicrobiota bacterium]|nr:hypothetical protein [Verrucomicrobiota bacterium]
HVCKHQHTVEAFALPLLATGTRVINPLTHRLERSTARENSLPLATLTLLPNERFAVIDLRVEGDHSELGVLGELLQFSEEGGQHPVVDRTGLVDGDY